MTNLINRIPALAVCSADIEEAFALLAECYSRDGVVYLCGNGGSAADADHIVAELMKAFARKRPLASAEVIGIEMEIASSLEGSLRALSLASQTGLTTAFANDVDPELVFAQQVMGYGRPGDVLWALSTSGNSANINAALKVARARGLKSLGLTGGNGGAMRDFCDVCICVPETATHLIQELHLPVYHALCGMLEERFFPEIE